KGRYDEDKGKLLNQVQESFTNSVKARELSEKAKKQANDALYETRKGREKVEANIEKLNSDYEHIANSQEQLVTDIANQNKELNSRIEESRKLGNDALYEVRQGRTKLETEINTKFEAARKLGNDALYEARANRQKMEANFGQELNSLRNNLNSQLRSSEAKTAQQVKSLFANSQNIIKNALSEARSAQAQAQKANSTANQLQNKINQNQAEISRLKQRDIGSSLQRLVDSSIAASPQIQGLLAALKAANVKLDNFDLGLNSIRKTYGSAINEAQTNIQIIDGRITKLERFKDPGVARVEARIGGLQSQINKNTSEIGGLKTQLNNNNKDSVNQRQFNELNAKLALIPGLIARVPDNTVRRMPKPLTAPQVEAATNAGVCRSTGPGGCMSNALGNTVNTINNNTNNWGKNLLEKLNAGANAAQLALLKKIDLKLGKQIAGGIGGQVVKNFERVNKFAEWLQIDRVLHILTWVNTTHNAYMLSSSITNTLFSAIDNVSNIFFKNIDGVDIDSKKAVSTYFDSMAKAIFGVEEWKNITTTIKKYNRIYQAGANIIDSARSMTDSVKNVAEFTAENTGKIGNALKTYQVIAPDAYKWMPEKVDGQSIWVQRLQNLEEAASGIEMVTGEILSITQNANEIKKQYEEFTKTIEESPPEERKDNKPVAEKKATEKTASTFPELPEVDGDIFNLFSD
ncbi:MAG: hypothetical protein WBF90_35870, partial [Rivularia sp. (in: cyanobacteria)]